MIVVLFIPLPSVILAEESNRFIIASTHPDQHEWQDHLLEHGITKIDQFEVGSRTYTIVEGKKSQMGLFQSVEEVLYIEEDQPLSIVNQEQGLTASALPWNLTAIEADRLLGERCDCKIAVVDSGIASHSLLNNQVKKKVTFMNGRETIGQAEDDSSDSHGTHVAGIIAGRSDGTRFAGISQDAHLYIVKALDKDGNGFISDLIKSVQWAMNEQVQIINLSLGTERSSQSLTSVLRDAYNQGVIVIAAAGNEGGAVEFPANSPYTIAVGAVNQNARMQSWSAYGPEIDIFAPGVRILSTAKGNQFLELSGTSMAAPHVSGAASKLLPLYTGRHSGEKVEWMRHQLSTYSNTAFQGDGRPFQSIGLLNVYRSFYEVRNLPKYITVQLANGQTQTLTQDVLIPYSDPYKRINIQRNLIKEEWQLN